MELKIVDTHVHFWDVEKLAYPWLTNVPTIKKTLDLKTFQLETQSLPIEKIVFIQCECLPSQYLSEVNYITNLATVDNRIHGIVSWFPLESDKAEENLQELNNNPLIKGIRRLEEADVSLYDNSTFIRNLGLLSSHNLTFDICSKGSELPSAVRMVQKRPEINYMLDHMGKPDIKNKEINSWKENIKLLAENPNVYCKISGLITEADLINWEPDDLRPYFDYAVEKFGHDRLVFGSDWPVITLGATYNKWINTLMALCHDFTREDLNKLFSENGSRFYRLS